MNIWKKQSKNKLFNIFSTKSRASGLFSFLELIPLVVPAALASFGLVTVILLLLGQFRPELIWPLGLICAATASYFVGRYGRVDRPGSIVEQRICDVVFLAAILIWGGFNALYTTQHVFTNRDPATYSVAGAWLTTHDNLYIDISQVFGEVPGVIGASAGFGLDKVTEDRLYAQGLHLLPALLGLMGRVIGVDHMLHLNPLFGMTALMAVYAFARLFIRPYWSLIGVGAFAASLPLIYTSRDTYTEPLAATFTFGALALLFVAQKSHRLSLWFLAGLVAGAGALTRIDSYFTIIGFIAFLALFLALSSKKERKWNLYAAGLLTLGMGLSAFIGWLDVSLLSASYYSNLLPRFSMQILLLAGVFMAGLVLILIAWKSKLLPKLDRLTRSWRGPAIALLIIVIALILMARPLWMQAEHNLTIQTVADLQAQEGDPINPKRSYAEQTTNWVAWYIGPVMAILGVIGLALAAAKATLRKDLLLVAALGVIVMTSVVFLIRPSITPDHIWASRRLVPVILPGLAIFGAYAAHRISREYFDNKRFGVLFTILLSAIILLGPLLTTRPFIRVRDTVRLAPIKAVCEATPKGSAILWVGVARLEAVQPTRAFCDIPAMGYRDDGKDINGAPEVSTLAQVAINAGKRGVTPLVAVYGSQIDHLPNTSKEDLTEVNTNTYFEYQQRLTAPPRNIVTKTDSVMMGIIQTDGSIRPLSSYNIILR